MRIRQGLVHHRRLVEQVLRDGGAARSVQLQARGRQHAFSSLSPDQVRLMALNSDDYDALLSLDRTVDSTRGADQSGIDQLPEYRVAQSSRALDCAIWWLHFAILRLHFAVWWLHFAILDSISPF